VRKLGLLLGVLIGVTAFAQPSSAQSQSLTYQLFQRTLDDLRGEARIPGMSVVIVHEGRIAWGSGLGHQDLEGRVLARTDTPYPIGSLAQTLGTTLLLRKCVDQSYLEVNDLVTRWTPGYPETETTIGALLSHTATDGSFRYAPSRMSALKDVFEACAYHRYPQLLREELFDQLAMVNSVPGQTLSAPTSDEATMFEPAKLERYADILRQLAIPYRVVNRLPIRNTDVSPAQLGFAQGVVTSALDLAQFDLAYDSGYLAQGTRLHALSQAFANGKPLPTGLGWFVQAYNREGGGSEPVAWQFGVIENAYSSLIVKVPNRRLTLILLANSDGLSAPFALEAGDVTTSIFARTFLKTFLP
jgi:CubicO group peptidase (beta-lactamase class C family)